MTKKVLALAATVALALATHAQITDFPYTQGFENGMDGWTVVDADGDGNNWYIVHNNYESNNYNCHSDSSAIASASWQNEALTPDNWLISPAITPGEGLSLVWFDAAQDADYYAEHYSVLLSTTDNNQSSFTTTLAEFTLSSSEYTRRSVDLSAYEGQTIFIAFRHHEITDEFVLLIDDISILDDRAPSAMITVPAYATVSDTVTFIGGLASGLDEDVIYTWECNGATFDRTDTTEVRVTFAAAGTYEVRFATTNNFGTDTAVASITVIDCSAATELPYSFQFNTPFSCWNGPDWIMNSGYYAIYGGDTAWLAISWSVDDSNVFIPGVDNKLVSPLLIIPTEGQYEVKYIVYPTSEGDHYSVMVRNSDGEDETIFSEFTSGNTSYLRKILIPDTYNGSDINIVFRHHNSEPSAYALAIAAVEVRSVTAPEVAIVAPRRARSNEQVQLSSIVASALDIDYSWTLNSATPSTSTDETVSAQWGGVSDGNYTIELNVSNSVGSANATHDIYIFNCERNTEAPVAYDFDNGLGCWVALDLDGDGRNWGDIDDDFVALGYESGGASSQYAHGGLSAIASWSLYPTYGWLYYAYFGAGDEINADNVVYSPAIILPQGQWHMTYYASSVLGDGPAYGVMLATSEPTSIDDFTVELRPIHALEEDLAGEDYYVERNIDLSEYAGQTIWIAFRHKDVGTSAILIDDVSIAQGPAPAGIGSIADAKVNVYPNPATSIINVDAEGVSDVQVIDATGRVVVEGTTAGRYDISNLAAGNYLVRVVCADGVSTNRIVKL